MALLTNPRHPFKEAVIHGAPDEPGIYLLLFGFDIVYVGLARESIRARLLAHCNGELKPTVATHYRCEVVPSGAEGEHADILQRLPKLPPYNAQVTE
jgi:hypothetical protein